MIEYFIKVWHIDKDKKENTYMKHFLFFYTNAHTKVIRDCFLVFEQQHFIILKKNYMKIYITFPKFNCMMLLHHTILKTKNFLKIIKFKIIKYI